MSEMYYDLLFEHEAGESILIDWGNTPQWEETHREFIESAKRVSLIPKDLRLLPVVSVLLTGSRCWIAKSRVLWRSTDLSKKIRVYFIGWKDTIEGMEIKSLIWVYPDGMIEIGDEPTLWRYFLGKE